MLKPSNKRPRPTATPWLVKKPVRASWSSDAVVDADPGEPADEAGVAGGTPTAPPVVGVEATVVGVVVGVAASTVIVPCIMV
jgi:hypothetical protein